MRKRVGRNVFWIMLLSLLCGVPGVGYAQSVHRLDPHKAITQYARDHWGIEDGLPVETVNAILQSRDGYLWIGTQEGLARFDGMTFTVFDKRNSALRNNHIKALYEDPDGTLWLGTRGGGLLYYRDGRLAYHPLSDSLSSQAISAIARDGQGALWVSTFNAGLNRIDEEGVTRFTAADGLPSDRINTLYVDPGGTLWVGTRGAGAAAFRNGAFIRDPLPGPDATDVTALYVDREGTRWVGTRGQGLIRIRDGTATPFTTEDGLAGNIVLALHEDAAGTLWIGTHRGGMNRYRGGVFDTFRNEDGLENGTVQALYEDREGSLWIGTGGGGVVRLWNGKFLTYTRQEGLPSDIAYAVYESADGTLWVGGDGGVSRIRDGRITVYTTADGLSQNNVLSISGTADGSLWFGTAQGLTRFREGRMQVYTTADGLPGNDIWALYTDPEGTLWIGTGAGLGRYRDGRFSAFTTADGLSSNSITAMLADHEGTLWVGTYDGGLDALRDGRVVAHYGPEQGLDGAFVLALHEDAGGVLWFGVREGGLYRLEEGRLTRYTTKEGLFNDTVQHILDDGQGYFWISCNLGLFRVPVAELEDYAAGRRSTITSEVFDERDGMKSRELMGGFQPAGWRSHDGRLWFPTNNGVVAVDPRHIPHNELPPPVVIERMVSAGTDYPTTGTATVPPGYHRFEFHYTGLSFIAPGRIRYEYMLEGEDEGWVDAGTRRAAYYTNLRPGTYRFRVRAVNGDGVWSAEEAALNVVLEPYFYQTTWFYLLSVLTLVLLAFSGYRWRINQLKAREQHLERVVEERTQDLRLEKEKTEQALRETDQARREAEEQREIAEQARRVIEDQADQLREMDRIKTRFFSNLSHEFRTPLTLNIGPLENALTGMYGTLSDALRTQLEMMLRNSRRLLRLINQLLDLSKLESGRMKLKVQPGNIVDFLEGIMLSFSAFTDKRQIDLSFESERDDITLYFDYQNLEKVFFNLISNAVKFTPDGGRIGVKIDVGPATIGEQAYEAVRIEVADTGQGIPAHELPHIFDRFHQVDGAVHRMQEGTGIGLSLVKELVELHGGAIDVESEPGVGTSFRITLPLGTAHFRAEDVVMAEVEAEVPSRGPMVEMAVFDETEAAEEALPASSGENPFILVVDDNADIRTYVAGCLEHRFTLMMAHDGVDGLEKARIHRPDLIISDVMMPRMNGYELCRALKDDEDVNHIPVILLTSKAAIEDKIEGLEAGADDYVAKPFSARELLARIHNLLHLREQQRDLKDLNGELVRINDALVEASEMKSQLLSIASHDMKNPLTAVREFANIIRQELDPDSHLIELLDLIYESTDQMLCLITQLLDSAALESGKLELEKAPCNVGELAEVIVQRNQGQAERKGQTLRFTQEASARLQAEADGERLQEAMDNLVSNAIKYSPHDRDIVVSVFRREREVWFSVRDEGPGLTDEDKRRLFGKFQKLSAQPTGGESSTGLGLSIVKQIIELHGGRVEVDSTPGQGSTFSLVLPALPAPLHEDHAPRSLPRRPSGNPDRETA